MKKPKQRKDSIYVLIAAAILGTALMLAPRLLPEIELSRRTVLWFPTVHQISVAAIFGFVACMATGRRRAIGVAIPIVILVFWGPNIAGAIEYSMTGGNENVLGIADRLGITPLLNTVYPFLYDSLGYSLTVSRP